MEKAKRDNLLNHIVHTHEEKMILGRSSSQPKSLFNNLNCQYIHKKKVL